MIFYGFEPRFSLHVCLP